MANDESIEISVQRSSEKIVRKIWKQVNFFWR